MRITVAGLGLIGASLCKAIKRSTTHRVIGIDINPVVTESALADGSIDEIGDCSSLADSDFTIVALYPTAAIEFVQQNADIIKKGSIVIDCCGVKRCICSALEPIAAGHGFTFIGAHPMAGREKNGYAYSDAALFDSASMILTPADKSDPAVNVIGELSLSIGFKCVTISTPDEHDRIIAYTSQIPHVLACAYVSDPDAIFHNGFSAGSYMDISRVADINAPLWNELFLHNRDYLSSHIKLLVDNLTRLERMICDSAADELTETLENSRKTKQRIG